MMTAAAVALDYDRLTDPCPGDCDSSQIVPDRSTAPGSPADASAAMPVSLPLSRAAALDMDALCDAAASRLHSSRAGRRRHRWDWSVPARTGAASVARIVSAAGTKLLAPAAEASTAAKPSASHQPSTRRDPALDVSRGVAVVLVVVYHLHLYLGYYLSEPARLSAANDWLGQARMPLMFLISGLLASKLRDADRHQMLRRAGGVAWLFLLWAPAYMVACEIINPAAMLVAPRGEIWYIWSLPIMMVLLRATRQIGRATLLPITAILAMLAFRTESSIETYAPLATVRYFFFFAAGALFKAEILALTRADVRRCGALAATAFLLSRAGWQWTMLAGMLATALAAVSLAGLLFRISPAVGEKLAQLGRNTLPVYLLHGLLIRVVLVRLMAHGLPRPIGSTSVSLAVLASTTVLIVLGSIGLRRWLEKHGSGWLFSAPEFAPLLAAVAGAAHRARRVARSWPARLAGAPAIAPATVLLPVLPPSRAG